MIQSIVKRLGLIAVLACLLAGCATPPYADDRAVQDSLGLSDPQEIQQRWGLLTSLIGQSWVLTYTAGGGIARTATWQVKGASMRVEQLRCTARNCHRQDFMLFYDPDTRTIAQHCTWDSNGQGGSKWDCASPFVRAVAQPDGSIKVVETRFSQDIQHELTGDRREGTLYYKDGNPTRIGPFWRVRTPQETEQLIAGWRQGVAQSDRRSSEFWGNVGMAMVAGTQAYADGKTEQMNRQAAADAMAARNARLQTQRTEPTGVHERAQQPAATTSQQHAATRTQQPASAKTQPAAASGLSAAATAPSPQRRTSTLPREGAVASPHSGRESGPKRTAYPEAIVVCTIPNEKGQFKCANPIHEVSGSKDNSLPEWRSPERMLASFKSTCWESRKLQSSTHLVWACGYGATGGVDHKDQGGPGVDAPGRRTFYCHERESSCRRTQP